MVEWKKLGDVCEIKGRIGFRGYTRKDQVQKGQGAISLSPGNISDGFLSYDSCTYISWTKYEESPEIIVHEGDIILCKTASVGKVARVMGLPEKATINPQLVLIKNITIHPQFLLYILSDYPFQTMIKSLAGVGSVPNVSQAKLSEIQIPIPPLSEQNRIVGILDTFTESIENLKKQISERKKQYEHYRDQLLDLEGKPGVEMKALLDILSQPITDGPHETPKFYDSGIPFISADAIVNNRINFTRKRGYISEEYNNLCKKKYSPRLYDVYVVKSGSTTGKVAIVTEMCDFNIWSPLAALRANDNNNPFYIFYWLQTKKAQNQILLKCSKGSQPNLSMRVLEKFIIPVPQLSEQNRIVSILDTFEASIANLEQQLTHRQKQYEYYRNMLLTFDE